MTNKNKWEKEFDKEFPYSTMEEHLLYPPKIKSFISSLLTSQKEEILKSLPKDSGFVGETQSETNSYDFGFNSCLEEIKRIIKEI